MFQPAITIQSPIVFSSRGADDTGLARIARVTAEEFGVEGSLRPWLTSWLLIGATAYVAGWALSRSAPGAVPELLAEQGTQVQPAPGESLSISQNGCGIIAESEVLPSS